MRRVLVDTGALVALARESDAYHTRAVHFFGELIRKYLDRPMDFADASLVWVAEQTEVLEILTTDSDFEIYRTRTLRSLEPVDW